MTIGHDSDGLWLDPHAAEGTVKPLGRARFAVKGRKGWYCCNAEEGTCTCGDWVNRRAVSRSTCRHLRHLSAWLNECPVCHGLGEIPLRYEGYPLADPMVCLICGGTGMRSDCDEELLRRRLPGYLSDEELRWLFR